ncbi:allantoicase [Trichomonascus vanleenenianus]|uniref:allantoicase n=1 Tax=Trichomonascus vanleenenianus TaxID=2268995 RepID=UPI003EC981A8
MSVKVYNKEEFDQKVAKYVDVIAEQLGGKIHSFSDEWFAEATNLLKPAAPIFERVFIPTGLKMDGWETRRHNPEPYDWVIIKLGVASAKLIGAEVDTAFFVGNYAPAISIEGTSVNDESELANATWEPVIARQECEPSHRHFYLRDSITDKAYTHVRLCQYPDGGIARFRLYGTPTAVFPEDKSVEIDLAHVSNGGVAIAVSDQHFGAADNLLMPGRGIDMSDGWETTRSRGADHIDWAIIKLGALGHVDRVVVDTAHYLGNYPQSITVHGLKADDSEETIAHDDARWKSIVARTKTGPNQEHEYKQLACSKDDAFTHVKLTMIPDGGVKRLRIYGRRV